MNDLALEPAETAVPVDGIALSLSEALVGERGTIVEVRAQGPAGAAGAPDDELLRRLLEFGFVEGARVELLHEGAINHDPIAVRLDDMRVALRRGDALGVQIVLDRPRR